jgi:hypothetical protein
MPTRPRQAPISARQAPISAHPIVTRRPQTATMLPIRT